MVAAGFSKILVYVVTKLYNIISQKTPIFTATIWKPRVLHSYLKLFKWILKNQHLKWASNFFRSCSLNWETWTFLFYCVEIISYNTIHFSFYVRLALLNKIKISMIIMIICTVWCTLLTFTFNIIHSLKLHTHSTKQYTLMCSQEPTSYPYHKADEFSSHSHILLF